MSYLGIDLGDKRVGIALSKQNIAFAQDVIQRVELTSYIKKTLKKYTDIQTIIVGLPYDLYGKNTRQLDKTQQFIGKLQSILPGIEIIGHDERFSSFEAAQDYDGHRDDIAAQCILQSYLDSKNK